MVFSELLLCGFSEEAAQNEPYAREHISGWQILLPSGLFALPLPLARNNFYRIKRGFLSLSPSGWKELFPVFNPESL